MIDDRNYYHRRAESELRMARRAVQPVAARLHHMLAGYYLDRVHGEARPLDDGVRVAMPNAAR